MQLRPGDRIGGVEIVRQAGAGGCGVVYEGRAEDGNPVAVKVLIGDSARAIARFTREAELLATLTHPNIARYINHGVTGDGRHFLVEEWADGDSLAGALCDVGMTLRRAVAMATDVSAALVAAHDLDVVHRDIKPSNILRAKDRWLVLDFGVARVLGDQQRLTRTGALIGTVGYMAPEQARGERTITAAADVFSLGCVLYEALTGQPAFAGLNRLSIRAKILLDDPPPLESYRPEAPPELINLVAAMLKKSPTARLANGTEVNRALGALGELPETAPRPLEALEAPTVEMPIELHERPELTSLVFTGALAHLAGDQIDSWRERLRRAVESFPGRPWVLEDGALIFASAPTESGPEVAARAAIAARDAFPELAISVVSTRRDDAIGHTIERAATALEKETMHNIFSDFTAPDQTEEEVGGIAIDETTAQNLPETFEVTRSGDKLLLHGVSETIANQGNGNGD